MERHARPESRYQDKLQDVNLFEGGNVQREQHIVAVDLFNDTEIVISGTEVTSRDSRLSQIVTLVDVSVESKLLMSTVFNKV